MIYVQLSKQLHNSPLFTLVGVTTLSFHNYMYYKNNKMYNKTFKGENLAVFVRLYDLDTSSSYNTATKM